MMIASVESVAHLHEENGTDMAGDNETATVAQAISERLQQNIDALAITTLEPMSAMSAESAIGIDVDDQQVEAIKPIITNTVGFPCDDEQYDDNCLFRCSRCPLTFTSRKEFGLHEPMHRLAPLCCGFCDKNFSSVQSRHAHVRAIHTGEKPFKCDRCNRRYPARSTLINHHKKCQG